MRREDNDWERPYRPGLVWQVVWWFDLVFAVPMFVLGLLALVVGAIGTDGAVFVIGGILASFSVLVGIGAWRLIHLGIWTSPDGVEIRSVVRRPRRFSWDAVDRFEVLPGTSVVPGIRAAPQVALITTSGDEVLVPGLWRRSPFTWGGVGPVRIVEELERRHPSRTG